MVLELLASFKSILVLKSVCLDDKWDQANRNFVVTFCIISGTIVTLKQNLGSSIQCIGASSFVTDNHDFVEEYCWTQGLYTLKEAYGISWPDIVPYPGIIPFQANYCNPGYKYRNGSHIICPDPKDVKPFTEIHHIWYQFVPFYFWMVGVFFYLPYTLFRHLGGIYDIKPILMSLYNTVSTEEELLKTVNNSSRWLYIKLDPFMNNIHPYTQIVHKHSMFYTVILVKMLYLVTSLVVFYFTHLIFQIGSFASYGYDWLVSLPKGKDYQVMDKLFPKMVACRIKVWGQTGIMTESLLCVLPQNVGNQYFFMIFWLVLILTILTNIISLFQTIVRFSFVSGGYKRFLATSLLKDTERYHLVFTHVGTTGRYILQICAEHTNPKVFEDLMEIITSLLISNYHKRKELIGRNRTGNTTV